jgi:hypothetical protein
MKDRFRNEAKIIAFFGMGLFGDVQFYWKYSAKKNSNYLEISKNYFANKYCFLLAV